MIKKLIWKSSRCVFYSRMLLLLAGLFTLSSCFSYQDIDVKDFNIDDMTMQGSQVELHFSALVNNPNRAFVISDVNGTIARGGQSFATAQLLKDITVAARSEQRYSGVMSLKINDLFALLSMGADYRSWDTNTLLCSGDAKIRSTWIKKRIKFKDVTLKQLLEQL